MNPDFDELVRHGEGETTQSRAKEIEQQLAESPALRSQQAQVVALKAALALPDPALAGIDLTSSLNTAIDAGVTPARPGRRRWVLRLAVAAAVVMLAPVVAWRLRAPLDESQQFGIKGGRPVSAWLEGHVVANGAVQRLGATLPADAVLGFSYGNAASSGLRYLMVFAVDSGGQVYWFYPAWTDAQTDPESIAISSSERPVVLPDAVQHALTPGPLVLHGLFTAQPLKVRDVEAKLKAGMPLAPPGAIDQRTELTVTR